MQCILLFILIIIFCLIPKHSLTIFLIFQAHNVDEDIPIGTSILKVKAADADSGSNADIEYYVSDDHFTVNSKGIVSNAKRLVSGYSFWRNTLLFEISNI